MTKLLVSVRDVDEAAIALAAGVALIDVKEPMRGAIGAADVTTIRAIEDLVAGRAALSAALGELNDNALDRAAALPPGLDYAKVALAGCAGQGDWIARLGALFKALPRGTLPVAVAYADAAAARAPEPTQVLDAAMSLGCGAVLVDTFDKRSGSLTSIWSMEFLDFWIDALHAQRILSVVAGSLSTETIPRVMDARPDFVAVRGAACVDGRLSTIDQLRVRQLVELTSAHTPSRASESVVNLRAIA